MKGKTGRKSNHSFVRARRKKLDFVIFWICAAVLSCAYGEKLHLMTVTNTAYEAGGSARFACFRGSPDAGINLSFGRPFPINIPGSTIEGYISLPGGTVKADFQGQTFLDFPRGNYDATGLFFCEGSKGGASTRAYTIIHANGPRIQSEDGRVTVTINKGENASLSLYIRRPIQDTHPQWRRISKGIITNLDAFDGRSTITVLSSEVKHGDLYVALGENLAWNDFAIFRVIVRGCSAGSWGPPACVGICDICYNGGVCDDEMGNCICPPGFTGPNCLTICPVGKFGPECEFSCTDGQPYTSCSGVYVGLPDPFGISCINGYRYRGCGYGCSRGTFGANCRESCHCFFEGRGCNRYTGKCVFGGCAGGWRGNNCQIPEKCPVGYYGINCTSKCRCLNNEACNQNTGFCSGECAPGFSCITWRCRAGSYGADCEDECRCLDNAECDGLTGACHGSNGACRAGIQADENGKCVFTLPVMSQLPSATTTLTSATIGWQAWGISAMDTGDGPVIAYNVYVTSNDYVASGTFAWNGTVSAAEKSKDYYNFLVENLLASTYYNFSVSAVRPGLGGEGPRSPALLAFTDKSANFASDGYLVGLLVLVCVLLALVIVLIALDYKRYRKMVQAGWDATATSRPRASLGGVQLAVFDNEAALGNTASDSFTEDADDGAGGPEEHYEDVGLPAWAGSLIVPWSDMSLGNKVLGKGRFGEVLLATVQTKKHGQMKAAVKQIGNEVSVTDRQRFMEEYRILTEMGTHPNVMAILAYCYHEGSETFYVAAEYLSENLRTYLRNARAAGDSSVSTVSSDKLVQLALDVAKGMQHIAASGVIHRKLAAYNIRLDGSLVAKIGAFGSAKCESVFVDKTKDRIPPRWLALETLKSGKFTTKSDVWSFGVVLWEITTLGATPYPGIKTQSLEMRFENGYRLPKPSNCDDGIYELMLQCWHENPNMRPSFQKLVTSIQNMDGRRGSKRYIDLIQKPDERRYMNIYPDQDDK